MCLHWIFKTFQRTSVARKSGSLIFIDYACIRTSFEHLPRISSTGKQLAMTSLVLSLLFSLFTHYLRALVRDKINVCPYRITHGGYRRSVCLHDNSGVWKEGAKQISQIPLPVFIFAAAALFPSRSSWESLSLSFSVFYCIESGTSALPLPY